MSTGKPTLKRVILWSGVFAALLVVCLAGAGLYIYHTLETEGQYFDSQGVRLHYLEQGTGPPVILLHGFGTSAASNWMVTRVFRTLAHDYRVIALDMRGHGHSGKPHNPDQYGIEMVHDIARLMDHLEIDRAHVAGYSLGGFLALKFSAVYPERTLSVASCASGWPEDAEKDLGFLKELGRVLDKEASLTPLLERLQPPGQAHSEARILTVNLAMSSLNDLTALGALLQSADALLVSREELEAIPAPILSIVGDRDPFREFAEEMKKVLPRVQLVVVESGDHFSTITKPEFTKTLAHFLSASAGYRHEPFETGLARPAHPAATVIEGR